MLDVSLFQEHSVGGAASTGWPIKLLSPQVLGAFSFVWNCALTGLTMHKVSQGLQPGKATEAENSEVSYFRTHFKEFKKLYVQFYVEASKKKVGMFTQDAEEDRASREEEGEGSSGGKSDGGRGKGDAGARDRAVEQRQAEASKATSPQGASKRKGASHEGKGMHVKR